MNLVKNKKIILCKVVEIKDNYIVVEYKNNKYVCDANQVSDFEVDMYSYFTIGKVYKFCLINNKFISYKAVRPKLIKNKKYTMPTISGARTLENHLKEIINIEREKKKEAS